MNCADSIFSAGRSHGGAGVSTVSVSKPNTNMPWTWMRRLRICADGVADLFHGLVLLHFLQRPGSTDSKPMNSVVQPASAMRSSISGSFATSERTWVDHLRPA